jgi:pyruvate/2-oxoglutarate dehydrogenase complex dihydrolipoamide dehydrogenase (E3) component
LRAGVAITHVEHADDRVKVVVGDETIDGSHLLVASGRRPNVGDLGLDRARIRCGPHGIVVNAQLRTRNRRVYAAGDVAVGAQFTHMARHQGEVAARNALGRRPARADAIARTVFTDPELAHVGLTDEAAPRRHRSIRVLRWPYYDNERAQVEDEARGHIKIVTDRKGRILGATIVGASASELIATWSLAISRDLDINAIAGMIVPCPTLGEIGKRAAMTYFTFGAPQNWLQRLMGWLRRGA